MIIYSFYDPFFVNLFMAKRPLDDKSDEPLKKKRKIETNNDEIKSEHKSNIISDDIKAKDLNGITKYEFKKLAKILTFKVNDTEFIGKIRDIRDNSTVGWHGNKDASIIVDNKPFLVQYNVNVTVKKSKEWKLGDKIENEIIKQNNSVKDKSKVNENSEMDKKDFMDKAKNIELIIKELNVNITLKVKMNKSGACGWFGSKPFIKIKLNDNIELDCNASVNAWIKNSKKWKDTRKKDENDTKNDTNNDRNNDDNNESNNKSNGKT